MSASASSSKRDPTPAASSGPKENEAGQASRLAHLESLLSAERRTLELISGGAGLNEILQDLCEPIDALAGNTISAVMLSYAEPRSSSASDLQLIEGAAHVALISIQSDRSKTALQHAYREIKQSDGWLRKIIDTIPTLAW